MTSAQPPYEELFTRNIGFVDENEQSLLRAAKVAVLGVGGMGGVAAQVLARAGVGELVRERTSLAVKAALNKSAGGACGQWPHEANLEGEE